MSLAVMCKHFGQRPSQALGIEDDSIAAAFDLAASHCLFISESKLEAQRLEALVHGTSAAVLGAFGGGGSGGGQNPGRESSYQVEGPDGQRYANLSDYLNAMEGAHPEARGRHETIDWTSGEPVYLDGQLVGMYEGKPQRIPMTEAEFIERTRTPDPHAEERGWETQGTPRII